MLTTHIDTLTEWWESAEDGIGKAGDVVIERDDSPNFETASYAVFTLGRDEHENLTYRRILHRAPKPKPAWYDAPAVVAHTDDDDIRRPFIPVLDHDTGETRTGYWVDFRRDYVAHALLDPVPLIEAKVTDEMVERARSAPSFDGRLSPTPRLVREMLAAALGLETT